MSAQAPEARTVPVIQSVAESTAPPAEHDEPGIHFLTDDQNNTLVIERTDEPDGGIVYEMDGVVSECNNATGIIRSKSELLEYLIRDDGSVACKLCGEVLASRTHWYRHKYKLHVTTTTTTTTTPTPLTSTNDSVSVSPSPVTIATTTSTGTVVVNGPVTPATGMMNPSPLFRCTHCNVFFKSRKGYMGHISARHSNDGEEDAMVATDETAIATEASPAKLPRRKDTCSTRGADWEQQREKEEKLVADIIDRVRRECEAQGAAVSRRGYSRRSTVMNTCN